MPSRLSTADTVESGIDKHSAISAAVIRNRRSAPITRTTRRRFARLTVRNRRPIDQPRLALSTKARQPPIDRALDDAGGLGRRRHRPRPRQHPLPHPPPTGAFAFPVPQGLNRTLRFSYSSPISDGQQAKTQADVVLQVRATAHLKVSDHQVAGG